LIPNIPLFHHSIIPCGLQKISPKKHSISYKL
jgi:hypothetical protein